MGTTADLKQVKKMHKLNESIDDDSKNNFKKVVGP